MYISCCLFLFLTPSPAQSKMQRESEKKPQKQQGRYPSACAKRWSVTGFVCHRYTCISTHTHVHICKYMYIT